MALDMHQLQYLTDAQKERYMLLQRFFESEYWKLLRGWAEAKKAEAGNRLMFATSWDSNRVAFGQMHAFHELSSIEEAVELEFANYAADAAETAEAVVEEGNE